MVYKILVAYKKHFVGYVREGKKTVPKFSAKPDASARFLGEEVAEAAKKKLARHLKKMDDKTYDEHLKEISICSYSPLTGILK